MLGTQFAKMLLVALGYDPKIEQLVGNSWAINTSKLALGDADLDKGMEEISLSDDLTRRAGRSDGVQRHEGHSGGV